MKISFLCPCLSRKTYLDCCGREIDPEYSYVHYLSLINQNTAGCYDAWSHHREAVKKLISESLHYLKKRDRCIVLGAGNCNDIPLEYLGENFQQVHLADIDRQSLLRALSRLPDNMNKKFQTLYIDLTGLNETEIFKDFVEASRQRYYKRFLSSLRKLRANLLDFPFPKIGQNYDLVVSVCVTTQLFSPFIFSILPHSPKMALNKMTTIIREISNLLVDRYFVLLHDLTFPDGCVVLASDIFEWNTEGNKANEFAKVIRNPYNLNSDMINNLLNFKQHLVTMGSLSVNLKMFECPYILDWLWEFKKDKMYIVRGFVLYPKRLAC
ncbi:hypothetical protein [Desulfovirgula thermocuniculi]|uniref:hypothetical protein n=1 Tax=Desulfovirgula thermocuniculi TaxID=348842 RepID=UPI0004078725|nr:hypothetical protein [Desulfovirgula thermocuniculi]